MPRLSERASRIAQSEIRIMSTECDKAGGINLSQGVCDTEVPKLVRDAVQEAVEAGVNSYTRLDGVEELRRAIAQKMRTYNGITADPEREVVVTVGSSGALYCAFMALLNPGDEVVIFEPYYGYHVHTLDAVEATAAYVTLHAPDWTFRKEDLERAITPRTKAILVNTPANPSGKVFSRTELEWIADCAKRHDLFVFTDEIYEYFLYDGNQHVSVGSLPGMADRTITVSGYSKTFSITGWRIGYAVCAPEWAGAIGYYHDLAYICAPAPLQVAVARGIMQLGPEFYQALEREYLQKRDLICGVLREAGLTPSVPQGSYYVLADGSRLPGKNSKEKAMYLLRETGVACVPGAAFYHGAGGGEDLLRFCYAKKQHDLEEACRRIEKLKLAAAPASHAGAAR